MDPVSAIGIAAAVVQFADFGFRFIKSALELSKSPSSQPPRWVNLSEVAKDLLRLLNAVKAKSDENKGPAVEIFENLKARCASINKELQEMLGILTVHEDVVQGSTKIELTLDRLRVAYHQVRFAGEIEQLANRLVDIRQEMNVAMLYMLLDEAGKNGIELRQFAKQQADMIATLDRIDSATKKFSTDIIGFIDKWPDKTVRYVLSDKWEGRKYAERTVLHEGQDDEKLEKVRQSLYFESISHRETNIPKRHKATFEWIFREPRTSEDGHTLWSTFPLWLREESSEIYWITGKPGAGKSTLVKFISQDPMFETLLQAWATGSQLLITRFFSWIPGANRLQKSQDGLFRTILLEVIRQRPQLTIDVFPARWFLLQSFNGNIELPDPEIDELRAGFRNLLSATGDKLKLALLIDGLDEFDETSGEDHRDLVHLIRDANAETGVKICVSSRPWNVFRDAFCNNPMLQLENLTREDIKSFVQDKPQLSPGYSDFAATSPQAARRIIADIVDKSRGVFLWVSVVSSLLQAALQEGARISDLQAIIENLPKEVELLFQYMWIRTSPRFRAEASQYFRLMKTCQQHETNMFAVTLWFGDTEIPVDFKAADVTTEYLTAVINNLERRLMSRTGGLLELVSGNDDHADKPEGVLVEYMHRTANDWVNENWESIASATDHSFDPVFWFVKGEALNVVLTTKPTVDNLTKIRDWEAMFNIASLIPEDHPDKEILVTALDRLDDHMVSHMPKDQNLSGIYWINMLKSPSELYFESIRQGLTDQFGPTTLSCTNLLELSARVPIPFYLKHRIRGNSNLFSTADYYLGILNSLIFGELWFPNIRARLDILDFLIEKYRPRQEWLCTVRDRTKQAQLIFSEDFSDNHQTHTHFTQVIRTLNLQITQTASQPGQNGAAAGSNRRRGSSRTRVASDPRYQNPKSKFRDGLRGFSRKLFGHMKS
ncbi:hypothetical protein GGI35DRAFT_46747 [Trichoderma velutinum]